MNIVSKFIIFCLLLIYVIQFSHPSVFQHTPTCELRGEIINIEKKEEFIERCTIEGNCPLGEFVEYLPSRYEITILISNIKTLEESSSDCLLVFGRNTPFTMNLPFENVHSEKLLNSGNILTANITYSLENEIKSYNVYDPRTIPPPPEKPKTIFGLMWGWFIGLF
ncbi:MAG: hypothetical protein ACMXYB_00135 [Candidatus Woesearchaeota archaeon]